MKVTDLFPSRFLRAEDLKRPVVVEIQDVGMEEVLRQGQRQEVPVLRLKGLDRALVLNRKLAFEIAQAVGTDDIEAWKGRKFVLTTTYARVFGETRRVFAAIPLNGLGPAGDPQSAFSDHDLPF